MLNVQRVILVSNFALEIPSAVFDQLSLVQKPYYALLSMILSFAVTLLGVFHLAQRGQTEGVQWACRRGQIPWFYSAHEPLGTVVDMIGLVCGIFQFISATITYMFLSHNNNNPIKISVFPLIFAFGVMCSGLLRRSDEPTLPVFERPPSSTEAAESVSYLLVPLGSSSQSEDRRDLCIPENNSTEKLAIHHPRSPESFFHPLGGTCISLPVEETGFWKEEDLPENDDEPFLGSLNLQSESSRNLSLNIKIPGKISSLESFQIQNIHSLHLQGCRELTRLPESLYTLENLRYMNIEDCPDLSDPPKDCSTHDCLDLLHFENCPNMFYPKQITLHQSETGGLKTIYSNGVNSTVICMLHVFLSIFHCFRQQQKQACKLEEIKNDFPIFGVTKLKMA